MDYRNEIIRMVQAVCPESALKKIYKFVRMVYNSLCGAERNSNLQKKQGDSE